MRFSPWPRSSMPRRRARSATLTSRLMRSISSSEMRGIALGLVRERQRDATLFDGHDDVLTGNEAVLGEPFAAHADHRYATIAAPPATRELDVLGDLQVLWWTRHERHFRPPRQNHVKRHYHIALVCLSI